jgi:hypothetical protein
VLSTETRGPSVRLPHRLVSLSSTFAVLVLVTGCNFQKPKYEVGDQRILIVPFRDFAYSQHGYGESLRGKGVVDAFRNWAEGNADPSFCEGRDAEGIVKALREWTKEKITAADWRNLATGTDADLILIGEIKELRLEDPSLIAMDKGRIRGKYTLINARTGRPEYESTEYVLEFPKQKTEMDLPMYGAKKTTIERGLIRTFGEQIAKDLFGYYAEE